MESTIYSVSEINNIIKQRFETDSFFNNICIIGEISNYKLYSSGHHYFSLKDQDSVLSCVMFKNSAYSLKFKPENGLTVLAFGRISSYPRDGKYQLYCDYLQVAGAGDLQLAFEQLKEKLFKLGLFDSSHKKSLPGFPERICVITSPSGAALHDIITILNKRWPLSEVTILPVRVQGPESPREIVSAIELANSLNISDLIILGRGGGSIEDLWTFNDESVAHAIYNSVIPIISGVGHEPDFTISDFVADIRASTPSNAAEVAVPDINDYYQLLDKYKKLLDPSRFISQKKSLFNTYNQSLYFLIDSVIKANKEHFYQNTAALEALSPLKVLSRGYSIVSKDNILVSDAGVLIQGSKINIRFNNGGAECTVDKVEL